MKFSNILPAAGFLWVAVLTSLVSAQLTADFSLDSSNYFSGSTQGAQARAAAIAAIADLNEAVNQNLSTISSADRTVSGSFRTATVNLVGEAQVTNPSSGAPVDVSIVSPQSVVRIYFGARPLGAGILGVGGPGAWGFDANISTGSINDVEAAVSNAANAFSTVYRRGGGPLITSLNGSFDFGNGDVFPFQLNYGLAHGAVSFNSNTTNFHFDHTTDPAPGRVDFYSVALHEAMHAIGLGPSDQWDNLVANGTDWTGQEVIDFLGSGSGVIAFGVLAPDENHVAEGVLSPTIASGQLQQSVLVPLISAGVRLTLTELDLAFMRDLGYTNAVVPPRTSLLGDFDLDQDVDLADLDRYSRNIGANAVGSLFLLDLNGNGTVDQNDFETHYETLVVTSNGVAGTAAGDLNLDGVVNVLGDAFGLIANLGITSATSWSQGDLNADGSVDVLGDAFLLIANLGANNG